MKESELKSAVEDRLTYALNQGKLWFARLNAGDFILSNPDGSYRRRIKGAEKGTADFIVISSRNLHDAKSSHIIIANYEVILLPVIFLELKSGTGKQTKEQIEFQAQAEKLGCRYYIIRDVGELENILAPFPLVRNRVLGRRD